MSLCHLVGLPYVLLSSGYPEGLRKDLGLGSQNAMKKVNFVSGMLFLCLFDLLFWTLNDLVMAYFQFTCRSHQFFVQNVELFGRVYESMHFTKVLIDITNSSHKVLFY